MSLYQIYKTSPVIGYKAESNWGGLEILNMIEDKVIACFNYGSGRQNIRSHKIYTTVNGRSYFRKMGRRYYLDEIMRVV